MRKFNFTLRKNQKIEKNDGGGLATHVDRDNKRQFTCVVMIHVCCHKYGANRK